MLLPLLIFFSVGTADLSVAAPATETLSQADAQKIAAQVNELGSDQSLRSSATTAMQALIKFGDRDITGAIGSAYQAYGKFKNSENLDRLRKQGLLTKAAMGSAGSSNLTESEAAFLGSSTSFRRLNPSFLSSGEDGKVAAEFEKKTGIPRNNFLSTLTSVAENKLYASDPALAEKIDSEFENFTAKIPNSEFRAKVIAAADLVPKLSRHKLVMQSVQKFLLLASEFRSEISGGEAPKPGQPPPQNEAGRNPAATPGGAVETTPSKEVYALLHPISLNYDELDAELGPGGQKLDSVVKGAIEFGSENETIFQIVSRRYRIMAPSLMQQKRAPGGN